MVGPHYQKYNRRTKAVVVIMWFVLAWYAFHYCNQLLNSERINDLSLIVINKTVPESYLIVVKAVYIVLQVLTAATWLFPQAMKSIALPCTAYVVLAVRSIVYPHFLKQ